MIAILTCEENGMMLSKMKNYGDRIGQNGLKRGKDEGIQCLVSNDETKKVHGRVLTLIDQSKGKQCYAVPVTSAVHLDRLA